MTPSAACALQPDKVRQNVTSSAKLTTCPYSSGPSARVSMGSNRKGIAANMTLATKKIAPIRRTFIGPADLLTQEGSNHSQSCLPALLGMKLTGGDIVRANRGCNPMPAVETIGETMAGVFRFEPE